MEGQYKLAIVLLKDWSGDESEVTLHPTIDKDFLRKSMVKVMAGTLEVDLTDSAQTEFVIHLGVAVPNGYKIPLMELVQKGSGRCFCSTWDGGFISYTMVAPLSLKSLPLDGFGFWLRTYVLNKPDPSSN